MAVIKRIASKATTSKIVNYLINEEKTKEKLVSGKDCSPENIVNEFNATQEIYGKTDGVKYHHIIQSFDPKDNITPEKAHQLGVELAERQFKGHEVFVVTHKDKEHVHNHMVVNSVSFEDGKKYNSSNKSLWDIKRESNRICEREGLNTIDLAHKSETRVSSSEKRIMDRGQIPWKDELRQCIDVAKDRSNSFESFREFLNREFDIETRITKKSISYKHPDHGKAIRGRSLGAIYDKEELENGFIRQEKSVSGERTKEVRGEEHRIEQTTRAKYESKNGIREYSIKGELRAIEETIRNVEFGVKGDNKQINEPDKGNSRAIRSENQDNTREQSDVRKEHRGADEANRTDSIKRDWEYER